MKNKKKLLVSIMAVCLLFAACNCEHQYEEKITTEASCTAVGVKTFTCSCEDSYTEVIAKLPHTEEKLDAVAPTCTESGLTTGSVCGLCGLTLVEQEEIAPHGHTSGDWIVDEAATCTGKGSQHKECQTCGATTKTESIPATGHKDEDGDLACDSCGNPV